MIKKLAPAFIALLALVPAAQAASTGTDGRIVYQVDQSAQSIKPSGKDRVRIANGNIAEPSVSPDGRHVVYTRDPHHTSGIDDIWAMRADGRHRERLTKGRDDDSDPAYSPDSRRIAFSRDGTLFLMNADGHQRRLAHQPGGLYHPSFAPDGRSLLADGAGTGLYSVRVGDGRVKRLTDGQDFSPDYSPDGRRIVFSGYRDTIVHTELYVMRADATHETRLTHDKHSDDSPVFSPDGTRIAFTHFTTSKRVGEDLDLREKGARIRVMNADGTAARNLRPGFGPTWASR